MAEPEHSETLAWLETSYVESLNAVLAAADTDSADAHRWRGQAESYRQAAEHIREQAGLDKVNYGSREWRAAHGVYSVTQVATWRTAPQKWTCGRPEPRDRALSLAIAALERIEMDTPADRDRHARVIDLCKRLRYAKNATPEPDPDAVVTTDAAPEPAPEFQPGERVWREGDDQDGGER